MKKTFFIISLLMMSLSLLADNDVWYLIDVDADADNRTITTSYNDPENASLYMFDFCLNEPTRVAIVFPTSLYTVYYGPDWDGLSSLKSDEDGYCWWTPTFDDKGECSAILASTSGTSNHIGMIIPKGCYSIFINTIESSFILKEVNMTAVENTDSSVDNSHSVKCIRNGQVVIIKGNRMFNLLGTEITQY